MYIREETVKDFDSIHRMIQESFATAEHADGDEQELVVRLRGSQAYVPKLALVAEMEGEIVGHVLFTEIKIGGSTQLALAPLAVRNINQKQGIGGALILAGHKIAKDMGYNYCVVLGSDQYYPKFGYKPAAQFGISAPFPVPEQHFMAIDLQGNSPKIEGVVEYAKEFEG